MVQQKAAVTPDNEVNTVLMENKVQICETCHWAMN